MLNNQPQMPTDTMKYFLLKFKYCCVNTVINFAVGSSYWKSSRLVLSLTTECKKRTSSLLQTAPAVASPLLEEGTLMLMKYVGH